MGIFKPSSLGRAFFCAAGIVLVIVGVECLLIDNAVLNYKVKEKSSLQASGGLFGSTPAPVVKNKVFKPSEWFPWSMVAVGSIVMIYSHSFRRNSA